MSRPQNIGTKVFDPAILTGVGQGTVSAGTPTLTSKPTTPAFPGDVSYQVTVTGTLAGTLTVEYSNSDDDEMARGVAQWDSYTITIPAISGAVVFGIKLPNFEFGRVRLKMVVTSGTGSITAQLCVKGA